MFIEVQKLKLFSGQKLPNLKQSLAWLTYRPLVAVNLLVEMILMLLFQQIRILVADQPNFKVSILTLLETSPD
jgi:type IV secretory pathway VirB3-like protein